MPFILIIAIIAILVFWCISVQRKLVVMDENVNNAMSQIGVQLSSRFDALTALLDLTKGYAAHESQTMIETIKARRSVITAKSTPDDVLRQEGVISEALGRISMVAEKYPELKAKIDEYRERNFLIQTSEDGNTLEQLEAFENEYSDFRENPMVSDFLAAELDFCRMMQSVNLRITEGVHFE